MNAQLLAGLLQLSLKAILAISPGTLSRFCIHPNSNAWYQPFFAFEKVQTAIYPIFNNFCSHTAADTHTFAYGGSQCLSESHGGSHD